MADYDSLSQKGIADLLYDRGMQILQAKEVRYGAPVMRELERICLLKCVDRMWMDHIDNMDQLRQGSFPARLRPEGSRGGVPHRGL